jgi:hypothetical protein
VPLFPADEKPVIKSEELKEHDHRLRSLEHSRGYMLGWAAAIGATVSFIANYMIRAIT